MIYNKVERERYNENRQRVCDKLGITKNDYNYFRREGEALHRIYEWQCNGIDNNGFTSDKAQARWDRWETEHMNKAIAKAKKLSLFIYFQTDPRGSTIYVDKVSIPDNNYTQANCIY